MQRADREGWTMPELYRETWGLLSGSNMEAPEVAAFLTKISGGSHVPYMVPVDLVKAWSATESPSVSGLYSWSMHELVVHSEYFHMLHSQWIHDVTPLLQDGSFAGVRILPCDSCPHCTNRQLVFVGRPLDFPLLPLHPGCRCTYVLV